MMSNFVYVNTHKNKAKTKSTHLNFQIELCKIENDKTIRTIENIVLN